MAVNAPSLAAGAGELQKIEALLGGSGMLARRLTDVLGAHELLLHGLPASALDQLVGNLVVIGKSEFLEKAVGMGLRTWQQRKDNPFKPLSREQSGACGNSPRSSQGQRISSDRRQKPNNG